MHHAMAATLDSAVSEIKRIWSEAREKRIQWTTRMADDHSAHA